jgi:hypothetical protein
MTARRHRAGPDVIEGLGDGRSEVSPGPLPRRVPANANLQAGQRSALAPPASASIPAVLSDDIHGMAAIPRQDMTDAPGDRRPLSPLPAVASVQLDPPLTFASPGFATIPIMPSAKLGLRPSREAPRRRTDSQDRMDRVAY